MNDWQGSLNMLLFMAEILQLAVFCAILVEITFRIWQILKKEKHNENNNG